MRTWQLVVLTVSCCSHSVVNVEEFIPQPITQTIAQPIAQRHEKYVLKLQGDSDDDEPSTTEDFSLTETTGYSGTSSLNKKIEIPRGCGNSSDKLAHTALIVWKQIPPCKSHSFGILYFEREIAAVT
ncbi:hypothetical protein GCK32_022568, partial [Trichostrongylus colubriformis]